MTFLPQEIIRQKRDGLPLAGEDIRHFVAGMTDGSVAPAQVGAFAMAVYFNGMTPEERVALTLAMRDSGTVLDWSHLEGAVVDKHSTGGIGDNVSLMLAPMLAACGCFVPMISGRGLGHSGGTLDKLESIPGYQTLPDRELFRQTVADVGCAIIGQTADLAPADGVLYGIRDVTATVENLSLIVASILSKKLAAGLDTLVLDVKTGNGAFLQDFEQARELAEALTSVANGAGVRTAALITDMNQPLATAAGNAVEIRNAIDFLTGRCRDPRLLEVTLSLGETLLVLAGEAPDMAAARAKLLATLDNGHAAERFGRMAAALGGPTDIVERMERHLPAASVVRDVVAESEGVVAAIDLRGLGMTVVALGGGRTRPGEAIDHRVGFDQLVPLGTSVRPGTPLGRVHARNEAEAEHGATRLRVAYGLGPGCPATPLIVDRLLPEGF
ncbi:MAG TPA: thymidine phosphorylase [Devosiaceae bacterium]|nr:thymidine phosphorylase [Devosiaceae bacterium]